ncbi:MFS transporter [Georgenia sp. MJ206]|uniref:MFS transporter n=1 Tax=Georgenia wangjunii TaxID=3117730 RepID=UPI002F26990C
MRALVVSGMALIAATYGLARFGYGLFLPQFTEEFALGSAIAGMIQAGSFLSYCLAAAIASRMRARPRAVVGWAGTTAALGSAGVALAPEAVVFALSIVIAGAGAGFATPGLVTLIQRNVAAPRQEDAQSVVNAGTGAGIVTAGALVLAVSQWRVGWTIIAALVTVVTVATLRSDRTDRTDRACAEDPADPGDSADPSGAATASQALRARELAPLARPLVAAVLAGASSAAVWTFGRSVMADSRGGEETYSVVAWMVLGAFAVLGATSARIVQSWSLRVAWALTSSVMGAATVLVGVAPGSAVAAYTSVAVFGASYTALSGVLIVWAVRILPHRAAEGTVVLFVALAVGQATGSVALGALLGLTSPAVAFTVAGIAGFVAVVPAASREPVPPGRPSVPRVA